MAKNKSNKYQNFPCPPGRLLVSLKKHKKKAKESKVGALSSVQCICTFNKTLRTDSQKVKLSLRFLLL